MIKNTELFDHSLKKPEPLLDDFYIKKGGAIISDSPEKMNKLMKANKDLLENITAFRVAKNNNNEEMASSTVQTIQGLMKTSGINYSEFSSFLSIIDVSYSSYSKLTHESQIEFLRLAIEKYLEMRHNLYSSHGYTATTLQVGKDAKSHKSSGALGIIKTASILDKFNYKKLADLDIDSFDSQDRVYIFTDQNGKKLFKEILNKYSVDFLWSSSRENKMPDLLFKDGKDFYIIEHKHMKEGGGGQDKQVTEIINFISYSENNQDRKIHYVTFLDGSYFNLFTRKTFKANSKVRLQLDSIKTNLEANPDNYFVNTAGFEELLEDINKKNQ